MERDEFAVKTRSNLLSEKFDHDVDLLVKTETSFEEMFGFFGGRAIELVDYDRGLAG